MDSERALGKRNKRRNSVLKKNNGIDNTEKLPDSVLLIILHLIPTELLRYIVKYVCRRWFKLITKEILSEVAFIVIERPCSGNFFSNLHLVEVHDENRNLHVTDQLMRVHSKGRVRSSCNELLLMTDPSKYGVLHVYNLISEVGRTLPLPINCGGHSHLKCGLALAFDKCRGVFKIVHIFVGNPSVECEIFEIKSESLFRKRPNWRKIDVPSFVEQRKDDWGDPISVNGRYIYWDVCSSECILSMDIVEEKFNEIPLARTTNNYSVLERGGCLGLELPIDIGAANMWFLNHVEGTEWQKLKGVRIKDEMQPVSYPDDIVLLRVGDCVIYKRRGICSVLFGYKQKTRDVKSLDDVAASE